MARGPSRRLGIGGALLVAAALAGAACVDERSPGSALLDPGPAPLEIEAIVMEVRVGGTRGVRVQAALPLAVAGGGPTLVDDATPLSITAGGRLLVPVTSDTGVARLAVGVAQVGDGPPIRGSFSVETAVTRAASELALEIDWSAGADDVAGRFELRLQAFDDAGRAGPMLGRDVELLACGGPDDPCPAVCGNGRIETDEACDGSALGGASCESAGFDGGELSCDVDCRLDTSACFACGDGSRNGDEQCDGADLGGATCESAGFGGGTLACDDACAFDASGCDSCGDGVADGPGEACDGDDLRGESCASRGFDGGELVCSDGCAFDESACFVCGDGERGGDEACDGQDLAGATCGSLGFEGGTLACDASCAYDTTGCDRCGDGVRQDDEACDGRDLAGSTCESEGFDGGALGCDAACELDVSACFECGDGVRNDGEACDGSDLAGATCESLGFTDGVLACDTDCSYDTAGCSAACGVSLVAANVIGTDLNSATGQIFVASIDLPIRLATPDAAIVELELELRTPQFGVEVLGCDAAIAGFVCEVLEPSIDPDAVAGLRIVSDGAATIGPGSNPVVVARPRLRLEFPTAANQVLVPIDLDDVAATADDGASCTVGSIDAGSVRVTDQ